MSAFGGKADITQTSFRPKISSGYGFNCGRQNSLFLRQDSLL